MNNNFVLVYSANGHLAGEMIRLLLESVNIPVFVAQESAGLAYGLTVGSLGQVNIYVPADQVQTANEVLRAMEAGKLNANHYPGQYLSYPIYKSNKQRLDKFQL
jgi:hypothetical protein